MMGPSVRLVFILGLLPAFVAAQPVEITDFFAASNRCDYLIITPEKFVDGARQLAQYRNDFMGDDVDAARLVTMEALSSQNPHPAMPPDSMLRESIAWAIGNWALRPAYIVFVGDDSVKFVPGDTVPRHGGPMPTRIMVLEHDRYQDGSLLRTDTTIEYSDNWYLMAADTIRQRDTLISNPPPAFGRIPCEQPEELARYIQKVKQYDALGGAPWRNRAFFLADNDWQQGVRDPIDHSSCAVDVMGKMQGRFKKTLFLAQFPVDGAFSFSASVKNSFFSDINNGCGCVIYFGHGHPSHITDEFFLNAQDCRSFTNPLRPAMFFSMSCSNAAFYKNTDSSMCKKWLLSADGGIVTYVASPNEEYAGWNTEFMKSISILRDSHPGVSIGKLLSYTSTGDWNFSNTGFEVLGDPAVRASLSRVPMVMRATAEGTVQCVPDGGYAPGDTLYWECSRKFVWHDSIKDIDVPYDSVLQTGMERLSGDFFSVSLPVFQGTDTLKFVAYAWNRSGAESRGEISICNGCVTGIAANNTTIGNVPSAAGLRAMVRTARNIQFSFEKQRAGAVLALFKIDGKQIASANVPAGSSSWQWNRQALAAGTYVACLRAANVAFRTRFIVP